MKQLFCVMMVLTLTACTPNTMNGQKVDNTPSIQKPKAIQQNLPLTAKDIIHPQGKKATPDEIAYCQKQGGTISPQGMAQYDFCVVEFTDKGKVCTDGSECQAGRCIAKVNSPIENSSQAKGVCPSNNVPFGCYGTVNKGQFGGFLCVD